MATTTELLRLVITADAQGAISGLEGVGASATKNLGQAEDRLERVGAKMTTFGAATVAGSAVVVGALYKASQMFEDAEQNQRKFDNSIKNSSQTFRNGGKDLSEYAQSLQQVTTADGDAVVGMQSILVQFGLTEDQIKTLTPLVVDLSQKMGVGLDDAAKAVGKSVDGSTGGLRRYGISIDESAAKTDAFGATVDGLRETVGGFAEAEAKTFNGQIEILKNNLGDIGESVGQGAVDVFGGIASAVSGAAAGLKDANPELAATAGRVAAIASLTAGGLGGLAVVVGQVSKVRDAFTMLGDNGERQLTRIGRVASGIGIAGAAIASVYALDAALTAATTSTVDLATTLDQIKGARSADEALDSLIETTRELDGAWSDVRDVFMTDINVGNYVDINGVTVDVRNLEKALEKARTDGVDTLRNSLEGLKGAEIKAAKDNVLTGVRGGEEGLKSYRSVVEQYEKSLKASTKAQDAQKASAEGQEAQNAETAQSLKKLKDATDAYGARLKLLRLDQDVAVAGAKAFGDAIEASTDLDDVIDAGNKYRDSVKATTDTIAALPRELDVAKVALGGYSDQQRDALKALSASSDATKDYLSALVSTGRPTEEVTAQAAALWQEYERQFVQAGFTTDQIRRYQEILGLTPEQVNTAIKLTGDEEARQKLLLLHDFISTVFGETDEFGRSKIEIRVGALVAEGDLTTAANLYGAWVADIQDGAVNNPIVQGVVADTTQATTDVDTWRAGLSQYPPAGTPVGANMTQAGFDVQAWADSVEAGSFGIPAAPTHADTTGASDDVTGWRLETDRGPNATIGVDADTDPANTTVRRWYDFFGSAPPVKVKVQADLVVPPNQWPFFGGGRTPSVNTPFKPYRRNTGGIIPGIGSGDSVPALLTPGEFVVTKEAARRIGYDRLHALNAQRFAQGGIVAPAAPGVSLAAPSVRQGDTITNVENFTIVTPDPRTSATEVARMQRDRRFLAARGR